MAAFTAPFITYTGPEGRRAEITLNDPSPALMIGRDPAADVALPHDDEVSRVHATLELVGPHWTILDEGLSRNGTFVNGGRLLGRRRLQPGDVIRVGSTLITYHDLSRGRSMVTRTAAEIPTAASLSETQLRVLVVLCRPYARGSYATPATNQQIAGELFLSIDAVKGHLRTLFAKFGVEDLPQNAKRVRLVERAFSSGIISERDLID